MRNDPRDELLRPQTATTLRVSGPEVGASDDLLPPTIAADAPSRLAILELVMNAEDKKASAPLPGEIVP